MSGEVIASAAPAIALCISLSAAILIAIFGNRVRYVNEGVTMGATLLKFLLIFLMYQAIMDGWILQWAPVTLLPGVPFSLTVDLFGIYFAFLSSLLWIVTSLFSIGYMRSLHEHAQTRYYLCFAVCIASTVGIAFSGNLLTFFIFYEILTFATYPLVVHSQTKEAMAAGKKYLAYLMTGGIVLLFAIILTYTMTGTLDFAEGGILAGTGGTDILRLLCFLFIAGVGVKTAIMPLHGWLPAAMVAPTPVSALLHAVAVVKAGAFGLLRIIMYIFGIELFTEIGAAPVLAVVAGCTIITASFIALAQDNLKMRLAYSTISQLSYIVLAVALLAPAALEGGIAHMMHQAFMKITLFFCAGSIYVTTGKTRLSEMHGMADEMPYTWAAFTIGGLGLIGIPLTAGFITKWFIITGALDAGAWIYVLLLLLSALLNAAYFLPPIYHAYFSEPAESGDFEDQTSWFIKFPLIFTAMMVILFGILPNAPYFPLEVATAIVRSITGI
ncbi:hypothetical protein RJ53_02640 [Methanocalculus chunghsingensis]|uniref:NADH:quinone oxidoreductase/Mrp antiporter transmembrane domain-containing protein n=1 Tax=Methanocalculus chunghsingensis TaxID=156457 RepID=A0A8J8B4V3_9EURY|nr:proton-conducting transporter membrane subunit [Methanocalculus chunghsingensis]MBR1368458.1 hypothetical protein [Methanocalculus chunghsingensis]